MYQANSQARGEKRMGKGKERRGWGEEKKKRRYKKTYPIHAATTSPGQVSGTCDLVSGIW